MSTVGVIKFLAKVRPVEEILRYFIEIGIGASI